MRINTDDFQTRVESVFHAAMSRRSTNERAAYLDGACGDDDRLREKVETLLQAHDEAGNFLVSQTAESPIEGPGEQIGRYKILQLIGEGGFGAVYMAEQQEPVRRKVALKIIKLGMDTKQVIARFEAERQALALMDHQNIAKVFDAGATDSGRPYFVMELVKGVPITEYCDRSNLDARARLALFLDVCNAIQHAHQKGIIHRDIKPTNVMVTLHDGRPVPKIIDFGVSKATNQRLTEKTLFTEYHQFIGTPQYMSPEQAEMSGLDIDTRSDLYSLGALLYELLTGAPPFEASKLREAGYAEIQRIIRDEDPPKPSTRVVTVIEKNTLIAKQHGVLPQAFSRLLRGELDCIVMKAMDKDRTRRYASASELANDVSRYLNDEPVVAAPPGVVYNVQKFVRRHRLGVIASCVVAASLVIGCTLAVTGFIQANREVARTQKIASYLQDVLVVSDPGQELVLTSDLNRVIWEAHQVFENDDATIAAVLNSLSMQLQAAGNYSAAESLMNESIGIWRQNPKSNQANITIALTRLGNLLYLKGDEAAAEKALREAIEINDSHHGGPSPYLANALTGLADVLQSQAGYKEAEVALRRAIDIRRRVSPHQKLEIALTINRLANVLSLSGSTDGLEEVLEDCLEAFRVALPANNAVMAKILTQTAAFYLEQENFEQAEEQLWEAIEIFRNARKPSTFYRDVAVRYMSLVINQLDDNSKEFVEKRRHFLKTARETLGEDHPKLGLILSDYSKYMVDHDQPIEAIHLATDAVNKLDKTVGMEAFTKGAMVALQSATQTIGLDPNRPRDDYLAARDGVETLILRSGDKQLPHAIKAALEYRLGNYQSCKQIIDRCQASVEPPTTESILCAAFSSMSNFQLGDTDQARLDLNRLRKIEQHPDYQDLPIFADLLRQVEQLLDSSKTSQITLTTNSLGLSGGE